MHKDRLDQEIISQFIPCGSIARVSAVDPATLTEVARTGARAIQQMDRA